jgi:hypothetical protein
MFPRKILYYFANAINKLSAISSNLRATEGKVKHRKYREFTNATQQNG